MTLTGAVVVFLTSLSALPISYTLNAISYLKDERLILLTGIISLTLVAGVPWMILRKKMQRVDSFFYMLSLLTFSSVISLVTALENDGLIAEFMGYYLREGEPYLKTAHGTMMSYWDGIAHYGFYLMMLAALSWNQTFYDVGLYWVGSFGYSKLVLSLAVFMGKDGLRWPFFLNFPCIVICAFVSVRFLDEKYGECFKMKEELMQSRKNKLVYPKIWRRPVELCFLIYYIFAACFTVFRFIAAMEGNVGMAKLYSEKIEPYLTDPLPFSKAQLMVHLFYFVPYYILSSYALIYPGKSWVLQWALIHAGAAGQAQFTYMGSSLHYRTPYIHRVPQTGSARTVFWILNSILFAAPQLAAYQFSNQPEFFVGEPDKSLPEEESPVIGNGQSVPGSIIGKKKD